MSHYTLPVRPRTLRRVLAGVAAGAVLAATGLGYANTASATPAADYYNDLTNNGLTIWDYPLILKQGALICEMLYQNINPYPAMVYEGGGGYSSRDASLIIMSAQAALCPGNAVTGSPAPQLQEAI